MDSKAMLNRFLTEYKYSEIQEEVPDKERYPLYYQASAHEYIINEGEMLFIPAGWFHVVYSDNVNDKTGLNFAMNFWYQPENNWQEGGKSCLLPRKDKHNLSSINPKDVLGENQVRVFHSNLNGLFPSDRVFHKVPGCQINFMTFDEFYTAKNPKDYIVQAETENIKKYAPPYTTPCLMTSVWINYGGARCLIHYDEYDNWLCQLQGRKRVILFPHEDRDLLYMLNPTPFPIITAMKAHVNARRYYIEIDTFNMNDNMKDVYQQVLTKYKSFKMNGDAIPDIIPTSFKEVVIGNNIKTIDCNYPLVVIFVTEGSAFVKFHFRYFDQEVKKGQYIVFPNHFTFPYEVQSRNLKVIVPV